MPRKGEKAPRWTADEVGYLRSRYPHVPNALLASELRRTVSSVICKAHQLGYAKSYEYLRLMGIANIAGRWSVDRGAEHRPAERAEEQEDQ
jgi:hypothetical protein